MNRNVNNVEKAARRAASCCSVNHATTDTMEPALTRR